jgi:hypothetical protein
MTTRHRMAPAAFIINKFIGNTTWSLIAAIVFLLASSILTVRYISSLQGDLQTMFEKDLLGQNYVQTARIRLLTIDKEINTLFLLKDAKVKNDAVDAVMSHRTELEFYLKKAAPYSRSKRERRLVAEIDAAFLECKATIDTLLYLSKNDGSERATALILGDMKKRFEKFDGLLDKVDDIKLKHDIRIYRNIDYQLTISIVFTLATLLVTIGYKVFVYRKNRAGNASVVTDSQPRPPHFLSKDGK